MWSLSTDTPITRSQSITTDGTTTHSRAASGKLHGQNSYPVQHRQGRRRRSKGKCKHGIGHTPWESTILHFAIFVFIGFVFLLAVITVDKRKHLDYTLSTSILIPFYLGSDGHYYRCGGATEVPTV